KSISDHLCFFCAFLCHSFTTKLKFANGGIDMAKLRKVSADRRKFLKGAAVAGAATLAAPGKSAVAAPAARAAGRIPLQDPRAETGTPPEVDVLTTDHCGSDFMVDVIRSLEIDYFCANPG